MSKTIWKIVDYTWFTEPVLDKYVVVYENKEYYYCKVSGTYELRSFKKDKIENDPMVYVSTSKNDDLSDLKAHFIEAKNKQEARRKQTEIDQTRRSLDSQRDSVIYLENKLARLLSE